MSTYKVKVNNTFSVELKDEEINSSDVIKTSTDSYHMLHNDKSYKATVTESDFFKKKYTIQINNNSYEVAIADALDMLIEKMGFSLASSKQVNSIKAPMPGLILDIHVKEGDEVKEDDPLLILEAMKMENVIVAPGDGKVKTIGVNRGEAIEKGCLLIEFE